MAAFRPPRSLPPNNQRGCSPTKSRHHHAPTNRLQHPTLVHRVPAAVGRLSAARKPERVIGRAARGDLLTRQHQPCAVRPKTLLDWQMAYCRLLYAQYMLERFGSESVQTARSPSRSRDGSSDQKVFQRCEGRLRERLSRVSREDKFKGIATWKTQRPSVRRGGGAPWRNPMDANLPPSWAQHYFQRRNAAVARELANEALKLKKNHPACWSTRQM